MKKLLTSVLVLMLLSFLMSCTSDDDNSTSNDSIVGTWKLIELNSSIPFDFNNDGTSSTNLLSEMDCLENETYVFGASNTVVSYNTSSFAIEVELVGGTTDEFAYIVICEEDIYDYALLYTKDGNSVTLNDEGDILQGTLNGNLLSFLIQGEIDIENENGELTFADITMVYAKQ